MTGAGSCCPPALLLALLLALCPQHSRAQTTTSKQTAWSIYECPLAGDTGTQFLFTGTKVRFLTCRSAGCHSSDSFCSRVSLHYYGLKLIVYTHAHTHSIYEYPLGVGTQFLALLVQKYKYSRRSSDSYFRVSLHKHIFSSLRTHICRRRHAVYFIGTKIQILTQMA
jgi:hypothetical protein